MLLRSLFVTAIAFAYLGGGPYVIVVRLLGALVAAMTIWQYLNKWPGLLDPEFVATVGSALLSLLAGTIVGDCLRRFIRRAPQ